MDNECPSPELPFLTASLRGVGGRLRQCSEDFVVEEIPRYKFSGGGEHTCLFVEKKGISTMEAVRRMSRALGRRERDFAYAGHKDARAVARQWFTVSRLNLVDAWKFSADGLRLLDVTQHGNALRVGHLAGNRFEITIRGVAAGAGVRARAVFDVLRERGVPNYFGPQRFGSRGDSDLVGRELVRGSASGALRQLLGAPRPADADRQARELYESGDFRAALESWPRRDRHALEALHRLVSGASAEQALDAWPKRLRFLFVSASQSRMFNDVLTARLDGIDRLETGDLAFLHRNGAVFQVLEAAAEAPRAAQFEISPSGPMFGYKMPLATGRPGELEQQVLDASGLQLEAFKGRMAMKARGERRALRVPLADAQVAMTQEDGENRLVLGFSLPAGSFATAVLREVMKCPGDTGE